MSLVVVAAPLLLAAGARSAVVREYARQEAERAIRSELGLSGVISDVDIEPRTLSVVARHIVLDHPDHGRFVEAELLRIRPSWWALLRGRIDLHNITIDRATLWLVVRDRKLINGPKLKASSGGATGIDLPFHKLWVKRSRLVVDAAEDGSGELSSIELFVDATQAKVLAVSLAAPSGRVEHRAGTDRILGLELRGKLTPDRLQVESFRLDTPDASIALRDASLQLPAANVYRGQLDLALQLDRLQRWPLPIALPPLSGGLRLHANVHNAASGPYGEAKFSLARATIGQYCLGENVELHATLDRRNLQFQGSSELIRHAGKVELIGGIELQGQLPLWTRVRVLDVGFAKLMEQLGVSPNAIVDWNLAGNFELRGSLNPLHLQGPLHMPTRDFKVMRGAWHDVPTPHDIVAVSAANLVGTVLVKPKGIYLENFEIALPNSKLHVQEVLLGFDNELRLRGATEQFDLKDASPIVDFPIGGKGGFDLHVEGTFKEPRVAGHLRFNDFTFNSYPFGDIESDFVLEHDVQAVRFPELVARKGRSRYRAHDFVIDFRDRRLAITSALHFDRFAMQDFDHVFHYENDERYTNYEALVTGDAVLRYSLGFPGDSKRGTL
ncbi:MAG TPA: hypothetical protein VGI70_15200, partial [Polyangiales bacterium]